MQATEGSRQAIRSGWAEMRMGSEHETKCVDGCVDSRIGHVIS